MRTRLTIADGKMRSMLAAGGLRDYQDFVGVETGTVVGRSNTAETRRIQLQCATGTESYFLKVYRYQGRRRSFRLRRDKGSIEAANYRILRDRCGVNVPDVVAYGSRRSGLGLLDAFILTRAVPNAVPLDEFVSRHGLTQVGAVQHNLRRYLLNETARLIARMHAAGFFHIDLQWRNLLVSDDGTDRPPLYLIDSARGGLRRWRVRREHGRLRDLSSLHKEARRWLLVRDQLRWLRRYFNVERLRREHHALIRTILSDRDIKDS